MDALFSTLCVFGPGLVALVLITLYHERQLTMRHELLESKDHDQQLQLSSKDLKVGHLGDGGIQRWSAGEIFPFHVVVVDHHKTEHDGMRDVFAMDAGGRETRRHRCPQGDRQAFFQAFEQAEADARQQLDDDQRREHRGMRILDAARFIERVMLGSGR